MALVVLLMQLGAHASVSQGRPEQRLSSVVNVTVVVVAPEVLPTVLSSAAGVKVTVPAGGTPAREGASALGSSDTVSSRERWGDRADALRCL